MLAAVTLNPQPGEQVLDLAAAPGGKTTLLAALMKNEGMLSAVEPVKRRSFKLRRVLDQQGVTIARVYTLDGRAVGNKTPQRFDKVLLDAPCSSEARFSRRNPDSWSHWSLKRVKESSRLQKRLILSAFRALKPGGHLLYSTCSFSPDENEAVVDSLLQKFPGDCQLLEIPLEINHQAGITRWQNKNYDERIRHCVRILPNDIYDGFFMCLLRKNET